MSSLSNSALICIVFYHSYVFYPMWPILSKLDLKECSPPLNFIKINWCLWKLRVFKKACWTMNTLLRLHSLVGCVRVKSSFLQCSVESTLNLENFLFQFLMEVLSIKEFLGHPLSLDRSMSGSGSWWSQFYNGWGWTSSMTSPHHSMEFDKSERLRSMDLWFSCFWDLVEKKGNFIYLYSFVKSTRPGKNRKKFSHYLCQYAESLQPSMLCIS